MNVGQNVCISVAQPNGTTCKVLDAKEKTIRERILTALFGKKAKVLIVSPYSSVHHIKIKEEVKY